MSPCLIPWTMRQKYIFQAVLDDAASPPHRLPGKLEFSLNQVDLGLNRYIISPIHQLLLSSQLNSRKQKKLEAQEKAKAALAAGDMEQVLKQN